MSDPDKNVVLAAADRAARCTFNDHGTLVGRVADLDQVGAFIVGVPRASGPLLLMGDPGAGKSALLAASCCQAEVSGMRVLSAAGVEYRARLRYGGLRQLLAVVAEHQPSIVTGGALAVALGRADGPAPEYESVADDILSLVRRLSRSKPVLLTVDDVQWLDPASAVVLGQVARRLDGTGAGLLGTARPGAESFFDYSDLPVHDVRPLSDTASEELLTRRFPELAPRVRRRLMAQAQGNPLALVELPVPLTDSQRAGSQPLPDRLPLTRRLRSALASRVASLPATTRYLLLLAALDGTGDLQALSRSAAGRCSLKHLAPAEHARLIRVEDPSTVRFAHPLTRSAVAELATSDQRRSAHRALAQAWQHVPERHAWHLACSAGAPDEKTAALLERAAATIGRRGDGQAAVAALLRAADLSPSGPQRARRLAEAAYADANITGDLRDVPRLLDQARRAAPEEGSLALAVAGSAYLLHGSGDIDAACARLGGALAVAPGPFDPADDTLSEALHTLLLACFLGGRPALWSQFDAAAARHPAAPGLLAMTRSTFADPVHATPSDLAALDAAVAGLAHESDPLRIVRVAIAGAYVDRLGGCAEGLHRVAAAGRRGENITLAIHALFLLSINAWHTAQWPELRQLAREGLDLCDQYHYPTLAWTGKFLLACAAAASGDPAEAAGLAGQLDQWAGPRRAGTVRGWAAHAKALSALGRGDFEEAYQQAVLIAPAGTLPACTPHALWTVLDLVDAAVRTGRHLQASDHVAAARNAGLDALSPRLRMLLHAASALAAGDDSHPGFGAALAVEGAERWPFDLARIHLYYGEQLRRGKAPARARHHLALAAETFQQLGAAPWTHRASQELRACGSPPHAARAPEPAVLTPQQKEIALLAAAGLSNKQIGERLYLSPRTVSTHLYQLFPKLGITSRAALRDAMNLMFPGYTADMSQVQA
jgi:DNA-binding CsgD family transcriptional regulator